MKTTYPIKTNCEILDLTDRRARQLVTDGLVDLGGRVDVTARILALNVAPAMFLVQPKGMPYLIFIAARLLSRPNSLPAGRRSNLFEDKKTAPCS